MELHSKEVLILLRAAVHPQDGRPGDERLVPLVQVDPHVEPPASIDLEVGLDQDAALADVLRVTQELADDPPEGEGDHGRDTGVQPELQTEGAGEPPQQGVGGRRRGDVIVAAGLAAALADVARLDRADDQDRQARRVLGAAQRLADLVPLRSRQVVIDDYGVGRLAPRQIEDLLPGPSDAQDVPGAMQETIHPLDGTADVF